MCKIKTLAQVHFRKGEIEKHSWLKAHTHTHTHTQRKDTRVRVPFQSAASGLVRLIVLLNAATEVMHCEDLPLYLGHHKE